MNLGIFFLCCLFVSAITKGTGWLVEFLESLWQTRRAKEFDPDRKPWTVADQQQWELTKDHGKTVPNRSRSRRRLLK